MPRPRSRSCEWLLALLVLRHGRAVDRSWLAGTLWPDSEESRALTNLRNALLNLRKALGPESERLQALGRETISVSLDGAEVDLLAFDLAIAAGDDDSLRRAVNFYAGPLLEGCFDEWIVSERTARELSCLRALETLATAAEARRDYADGLDFLRRAEAIDPLRDSVQRSLMRILAASGDTPAALLTYRNFRIRLEREMSLQPDIETSELYRKLRETAARKPALRASTSLQRGHVASSTSIRGTTTALPHPITALIGRDDCVREVVREILAGRLVTLVGTGGVGKTRLCIQAASEVADEFAGGVVFVPLASLLEPDLLLSFVASAIGLRDENLPGVGLLESVVGWLTLRPILLVLDNCEHLLDATATLTRSLLERCPLLHVLATSRQRLGLTGERVWRVPSLPAPQPDLLQAGEEGLRAAVLPFPAVQLFCERARMIQPAFDLHNGDDIRAVAQICHRLDGIPLAIELAASRAGMLTVAQIEARLGDRFRLLIGGGAGELSRHKTLLALIDWSYELLSEDEPRLLHVLSVFADGWTMEAFEEMTGADGAEGARVSKEPLDLLASLIDKSLISVVEHRDARRYRMLETIREYAASKLRESGEEAAAQSLHLSYILRLAKELSPALRGPARASALPRLESETSSWRAALQWAQTGTHSLDCYVQLTAALWPYWETHGLQEGLAHLRAAHARTEGFETAERAQILLGEARFAHHLYELDDALALARMGVELCRKLSDTRGSAEAHLYGGIAAREKGDLALSVSLLDEGLKESRASEWTRGCAIALIQLGSTHLELDRSRASSFLNEGLSLAEAAGDDQLAALALQVMGQLEISKGDISRGRRLFERALETNRRLRLWPETVVTLRHLGLLTRRQGDLSKALACLQEAVGISRHHGRLMGLAMCLSEYGSILYERGEYGLARDPYTECLTLFRHPLQNDAIGFGCNQLGSTLYHLGEYRRALELHHEALNHYLDRDSAEGICWTLERIAIVESAVGDPISAAQMLGSASRAREVLEKPLDRWDREDWDEAVAAVRAAMGELEFRAAWNNGVCATREQAIASALRNGPRGACTAT